MHKRKFFFIVFEGIEGSGKSYQSKKLFKNIKKKNFPVVLTREPGGTIGAERIRQLILKDYFHKNKSEKFHKYTDTLLYLAARNEHIQNKILKAKITKKILICDRFIDSTIAYQVYGKSVNKSFIEHIHKFILQGISPNLTFILKVSPKTSAKRLKKRKTKNRYDNFSQSFYTKAQKAFLKIANKKKNCYILNSSSNDNILEKKIFKIVCRYLKI